MIGVLGHDSAMLRLYWAGDNLGEWDEFCYESWPWCRIDRSTFWPAVQRATTVKRIPPNSVSRWFLDSLKNLYCIWLESVYILVHPALQRIIFSIPISIHSCDRIAVDTIIMKADRVLDFQLSCVLVVFLPGGRDINSWFRCCLASSDKAQAGSC